jgi:predicted anti-sigma-YlaC factor YlaD
MIEHRKSCREILAPLSEYISGEAAESLCAEIEAHLSECENCRIVVDTVKKTILLYQSTAAAELPTDVRRRLYQILDLDDYLVE